MKTYYKGARAERELLHFLSSRGCSCMRAASSGGYMTPVDIIAMKKGSILCFEIKNWAKKPKLDADKIKRFREWCTQASGMGFLAWYNDNRWRFLTLTDAEGNRYEDENWIEMRDFFRIFGLDI
jgi:Holliday junction resolvase